MSVVEYQFVDTNVLVYAYDNLAGGKYTAAGNLIEGLWQLKTGCLSIQVLQEFYVTVTAKIKKPLSQDAAAQLISFFSTWKIHAPEVRDISRAIEIQRRYRISFWDALIVNSASKLGCALLWSEDLSDGQVYEGVRVQNPFIGKE